MRWCVDIGYPAEQWGRDEELREIAHKYDAEDLSAGCGWGVRDMQFYTNRKWKARELADRFRKVLDTAHAIPDPLTDGKFMIPYVSEPIKESHYYWFFLLQQHDFKEFFRLITRRG